MHFSLDANARSHGLFLKCHRGHGCVSGRCQAYYFSRIVLYFFGSLQVCVFHFSLRRSKRRADFEHQMFEKELKCPVSNISRRFLAVCLTQVVAIMDLGICRLNHSLPHAALPGNRTVRHPDNKIAGASWAARWPCGRLSQRGPLARYYAQGSRVKAAWRSASWRWW
jgi:hypothetical protein